MRSAKVPSIVRLVHLQALLSCSSAGQEGARLADEARGMRCVTGGVCKHSVSSCIRDRQQWRLTEHSSAQARPMPAASTACMRLGKHALCSSALPAVQCTLEFPQACGISTGTPVRVRFWPTRTPTPSTLLSHPPQPTLQLIAGFPMHDTAARRSLEHPDGEACG